MKKILILIITALLLLATLRAATATTLTINNTNNVVLCGIVNQYSDIIINSGGKITVCAYDGTNPNGTISLQVTNFTLASGGIINGNITGFLGVAGENGTGPGRGTKGAGGSGAGYGGNGGQGFNPLGGLAYGSSNNVTSKGSSGGGGQGSAFAGGKGGGLIIINASNIINISGIIYNNGGLGSGDTNYGAGGGSGGGIWLITKNIIGTGSLIANGRSEYDNNDLAGDGAGGRIYVQYCTNQSATFTLTALEGQERSINNGQNGTTNISLRPSNECDAIPPQFGVVNTNGSAVKVNGVANWTTTITDNVGISKVVFGQNQTGVWTNTTYNLSGETSTVFSYNLSIYRTVGITICGQYFSNDTANNWNNTAQSCFTVADTTPTITTQNTFLNASVKHTFIVNATSEDVDGLNDLKSVGITSSSGTCANILNSTTANSTTAHFNCTGTALASTNIQITFTDQANNNIATTLSSNAYPNNAPTLSAVTLNQTSFTVMDWIKCNDGTNNDADSDSLSFTYEWYMNNVTTGFTLNEIPPGAFGIKGDWFKCTQSVTDGVASAYANSSQYAINNSPPVLYDDMYILNSSVDFSFILNASAFDYDGASDIKVVNISSFRGTCTNYQNSSVGNVFTSWFNCTLTPPLQATSLRIQFTDLSQAAVNTSTRTNTYPEPISPVINSIYFNTTDGCTGSPLQIIINSTDNWNLTSVTYWIRNSALTEASGSLTNTTGNLWMANYTATGQLGSYTLINLTAKDQAGNRAIDATSWTSTLIGCGAYTGGGSSGGGGGGGGESPQPITNIITQVINPLAAGSNLTSNPSAIDTYYLYLGFINENQPWPPFKARMNADLLNCTATPPFSCSIDGKNALISTNIAYQNKLFWILEGTIHAQADPTVKTDIPVRIRVINFAYYIPTKEMPIPTIMSRSVAPYIVHLTGTLVRSEEGVEGKINGIRLAPILIALSIISILIYRNMKNKKIYL